MSCTRASSAPERLFQRPRPSKSGWLICHPRDCPAGHRFRIVRLGNLVIVSQILILGTDEFEHTSYCGLERFDEVLVLHDTHAWMVPVRPSQRVVRHPPSDPLFETTGSVPDGARYVSPVAKHEEDSRAGIQIQSLSMHRMCLGVFSTHLDLPATTVRMSNRFIAAIGLDAYAKLVSRGIAYILE